jgi:hypothetical protein
MNTVPPNDLLVYTDTQLEQRRVQITQAIDSYSQTIYALLSLLRVVEDNEESGLDADALEREIDLLGDVMDYAQEQLADVMTLQQNRAFAQENPEVTEMTDAEADTVETDSTVSSVSDSVGSGRVLPVNSKFLPFF